MKSWSPLVAVLAACLFVAGADAQDKEIKVEVETVVDGLDNPSGVAIQPGTGHIFVSDSAAGRIIRINPESAGEPEAVITDFPQDVYGKGPMYNIGPLGIAFITKDLLVVGGGGHPDGEELLRFYEVPEPGKSIKADDMKFKMGPLGPSEETKKGEGNFYDIAATPTAIYVTSNGDDTKGWVAKVEMVGNEPKSFKPFIATKVATEVDAPVGIDISLNGFVVVGQMGEINKPGDSLLTFYRPKDGKMVMNLETGLHDIAGLAYSPRKRLYAIDFAWLPEEKGGLYRLDEAKKDGKIGCEPVKVVELDKPTALTFDSKGTLYVTVYGTAEEGSDKKPGKLLKITGDL